MNEKLENIANSLDQLDKASLKKLADTFAKLGPRWVLVPWDELHRRRHELPTNAPVETNTEVTVTLTGFDAGRKMILIREVRAITNLGLVESKTLVEKGGIIKAEVSKDEGERIASVLTEVGGVVDVK